MPAILNKPLVVAVLGSGGREHALTWALAKSPLCSKVFVVPGNPGMLLAQAGYDVEKVKCVAPEDNTIEGCIATLKKYKVEFVVIGPDDFLSQGYTDALLEAGFVVFGPTKKAARLEWSKAFAKEILHKAQVPTAKSVIWESLAQAQKELMGVAAQYEGFPLVLKYDGLALGKGVCIAQTEEEALKFLKDVFEDRIFERKEQKKSNPVVICEEFLLGHEASVFGICDGREVVLLEPACDHKRLSDGNRGPNTGGMGAYSPVPWLNASMRQEIKQKIFLPVLQAMREARASFQGLLYAGLMVSGGKTSVLEFNARFGDPETQALMPRLTSDILPVLWGAAQGDLEGGLDMAPLRWRESACVNVVAASPGYPQAPRTGLPLLGITAQGVPPVSDSAVFFAGVQSRDQGLETSGGRVFSVSSLGASMTYARDNAYAAFDKIYFEGMHVRRDIGVLHD